MKLRLVAAWQEVRASYWFVPAVMAVCAVLLARAALEVDESLQTDRANQFDWLYSGGASGARAVLAAIGGSTIAVAGTTFSITIAVLQLTSGQFGPRLLRNFMRDTGNQVVLGTFTATFLYCLLILRQVRDLEDVRFVPHLAVTVGIALGVVSVGVLIYFIHHIAASIQAANVIAVAGQEFDAAIDRLFPEAIGEGGDLAGGRQEHEAMLERLREEGVPIQSPTSGYLRAVDSMGLLRLAREHDVIILLLARPGDYMVEGLPLVKVYPAARDEQALTQAMHRAFVFGNERSPEQDAEFPANQLVEIAARALSPGINDPFTAITCIDRLSAGLCRLARRAIPSPYRFDDEGRLRVVAAPVTFAGLVDSAFGPILRYGAAQPAVLLRLLEAIARIGACITTLDQRLALTRHVDAIEETGRAHLTLSDDQATLTARLADVRAVLATRQSGRGDPSAALPRPSEH